MMARKDKVVDENTNGVDYLFRKNKIERIVRRGGIHRAGHAVSRSTARPS